MEIATASGRRHHRHLEGRRVGVALRDGSRLDDCVLVSAGRGAVDSLWLFGNGTDTFARGEDVIDLWEVVTYPARITATR